MGRRMALRVVLPPVCISSPAAAQEASAWMGELSRTGALQPADDVYVADSADGWIKATWVVCPAETWRQGQTASPAGAALVSPASPTSGRCGAT